MRHFHIGAILSVTTGRLVAPNGIEDVYSILNHMTGDNLFTHQLPRAGEECKPWLLRQHPQLVDASTGALDAALASSAITGLRARLEAAETTWQQRADVYHRSGRTEQTRLRMWEANTILEDVRRELKAALASVIDGWLQLQAARFGETLPVEPIPADDHTTRDPIQEMFDMVGKDKVIVVDATPDTTP